jgi:hypothetical protein
MEPAPQLDPTTAVRIEDARGIADAELRFGRWEPGA